MGNAELLAAGGVLVFFLLLAPPINHAVREREAKALQKYERTYQWISIPSIGYR